MQQTSSSDFEEVALPHLNDAYALARWLARNEQDAKDIVQEAYLRALHYYSRFRGSDFRPWLLKIVRNTFYTWNEQNGTRQVRESSAELMEVYSDSRTPEEQAIASSETQLLREALWALPPHLRELVILREFEGLSYREISGIAGVPLGTVMSGLSRARARLRQAVANLLATA